MENLDNIEELLSEDDDDFDFSDLFELKYLNGLWKKYQHFY